MHTHQKTDQECYSILMKTTKLFLKSKIVLLFILCTSLSFTNIASPLDQRSEDSTTIRFYELELRSGKLFPNNKRFIEPGPLYSVLLSFGKLQNDPHKNWTKFHNYPFTGITFGITNLGDPNLYGYELKAIPFVEYVVGKQLKNRPTVKIGLGVSYTTQNFRTNIQNFSLGSPINWAFELNIRQNLITSRYGILRLGIGYAHSSNGHTQLPNMGINALVANLSFLQFDQTTPFNPKKTFNKPNSKKKITYFLQINPIIGFHELGGPLGPQYGPKRNVYGSNFMAGLFLNGGFKFYVGFGYRYYEHFSELYKTVQHADIEKSSSALAFASNFYILNGLEFIYGHFGFTFEGGLNLYKPFYKTYCDLYSPENPTKYFLKKNLNSRIGLKAYLYNASDDPEHNFFIGAHVNANLGQADFSELSFGYVHRLD